MGFLLSLLAVLPLFYPMECDQINYTVTGPITYYYLIKFIVYIEP